LLVNTGACTRDEAEPIGTAGAGVAAPQGGSVAAPQGGTPSVSTGDVPCDVAALLEQQCASCHGATPRGGAPLALTSAAAFHADRQGQTVGAIVMSRVRDATRPMPPMPLAMLSAGEVALLGAWIDAGALPANPGCAIATPAVSTGGTVAPPPVAGVGGGNAPPDIDGGTSMQPEGDWTAFGRDLDNTRSNPVESTLGIANVASLRRLWSFDGPASTSTPAVVEGVVYLPGWDGKVYALRADDGSEVWTATLPNLIDSSPAVTATRVFISDDAGSMHALDRASGTVQWSVRVDAHPEAHLWSSPVYIAEAGLLVVGVASQEETLPEPYTFRGSVVALDAETGQERWRVYTTDNDATSGPGIAVWGTAAVDVARKLLYIGTGNNYAEPAGPLSDALLAIDYETGMLEWATQFTEGDVFTIPGARGPDFDIGSSANLFTAGGKDLVGIGVKSGNYFALDRDAGTIEWMVQVSPGGPLGGVMSATAYSSGMIYAAANDMMAGQTVIAAIDAATGQIPWRHQTPMSTYGGVAHANGVVYVGTTAGTILAVDAASGTELWSDQTPDSIAGSPVVSGGMLLVPWGYQWTLRDGMPGTGGLIAYGL
jgi:polyvinyl alcohol dehydrogenase (cytochrome)